MNKQQKKISLDSDFIKISEATHHDPFSVLGRHTKRKKTQVTLYLRYAE
ncbi:MAG: hypothetical protein KAG10_08855 [Methylococcales bacterium]|nr:hypothetical protein [Methylococcales bacterium]